MTIAEFVKERRKKQHWTQKDLAFYGGVGLRFIRELEQGKTTLRMDKVNQILDMFGAVLTPGPNRRLTGRMVAAVREHLDEAIARSFLSDGFVDRLRKLVAHTLSVLALDRPGK
ncbi:MAG: helix-turn-helix transcriptional regulator [Kiritimatiellae bacterium]|jgi:y4mF family transcriptional regulator|nr:helix-turn-helix transcriptional regulator [Kiritimatiellia bacterium]